MKRIQAVAGVPGRIEAEVNRRHGVMQVRWVSSGGASILAYLAMASTLSRSTEL